MEEREQISVTTSS